MEPTTVLLSVRRLLAFACLQLSLVLLGVALIAERIVFAGAGFLLLAAVVCLLASGVWLFKTVTTPNPAAYDGARDEAADDSKNAEPGSAGEDAAAGVESD